MIENFPSRDWRTVVTWWWPVAVPALLLAGVCGAHLIGFVREDYGAYLNMFAWARVPDWIGMPGAEPPDYYLPRYRPTDRGFAVLLLVFAKCLPASDFLWFFLIALLGLGVKFFCFRQFSPVYWVALLVHVAMFFVLHDYTQLRASLGIAFLMLGAGMFVSAKRYGMTTGSWLLAGCFHLSTLVAMVFVLAFVFMMPAFYAGTALSLLSGQLFAWASSHIDRFAVYLTYRLEQPPNPFSSLKLYQYLTLMLFLYYRVEIRSRGWRMVELSGWFLLAGLAFFIGFLRFPAGAHRMSELFLAFMPFVVSGLFVLMPRRFGVPYVGAAVAIGAWMSYRVLYVWQ